MSPWIIITVLVIHIFSAIFFIGGSFFIWFIVWPVSYKLTDDESYRTRIVGLIGRLFGYYTNALVIILVATGLFLRISLSQEQESMPPIFL